MSIVVTFEQGTGFEPRILRVVTNSTLSEVTTAGWLNSAVNECIVIQPSDKILIYYGVGSTPGNAFFDVSISAGVITLSVAESNVILPVVSGDFAVFSGTSGAIADLGYSPSDAAKTKVVMANGAVVAGNIAVYTDTAGTVDDNLAGLNTVANASATPGTVRSLTGAIASSAVTMTSGNLVGVRGSVTCVGASGGFLYGAQGKVIASGTLSGSSWSAGVFGQLDISAATVNAGQMAAIWGDYGTSSGTMTDVTGLRGVAMTNTTAAVLNAQDYRYGNATYLLELAGAGGTLNYYAAAGTSAGSAGDAAHCAAQQVIKIEINGVAAYIPVFTQNT